jgi:mRNA-degrading endonuclease HigB of HigAB toxin-antitoxin module
MEITETEITDGKVWVIDENGNMFRVLFIVRDKNGSILIRKEGG